MAAGSLQGRWRSLIVVLAVGGLAVMPSAGATANPKASHVVSLVPSVRSVKPGSVVRLLARVRPASPNARTTLERLGRRGWASVAAVKLGRSSSATFRERVSSVGSVFWRVVVAGAGVRSVASSPTVVVGGGSREFRSRGKAFRLTLGGATVSAPTGSIRAGKTLTLSVGSGQSPGSPVSANYRISTNQREPAKPVGITLPYSATLLAHGDRPLVLHDSSLAHGWVPMGTSVNKAAGTVTTSLASFSVLDVIDDGTYYAGLLTGNRADLPDCKDSGPPPWVHSVTLPYSKQAPLPICFSAEGSSEATLSMVNNRGFAQLVSISGIPIDLHTSHFSDTLDGTIASGLASHDHGTNYSYFVLGPGQTADVSIERPPPTLASLSVHIATATPTASAAAEMAWAFATTAKDQLGVPVAAMNCLWSDVYNARTGGSSASIVDELNSCGSTIATVAGGAVREAVGNLAKGLLVANFFYKIVDSEFDPDYAPDIGFTIPGTNPSATNPSIHVGPSSFGTISSGEETTEQLSASGGQAPYRYYIYIGSANDGRVPSWVRLAPTGALTLDPPAGDQSSYSFYVYAFDNTNQHSPFARDLVSFSTTQSASKGGGGTPSDGTGSRLAASVFHTCYLSASGTVDCWGDDQYGELGDGSYVDRSTPASVTGITNAIAIAASAAAGPYTCALLSNATIDCWGRNIKANSATGRLILGRWPRR